MISVLDRIGNIVGKGENEGHQHFLLFSQCFLKLSLLRSQKLTVIKGFDKGTVS